MATKKLPDIDVLRQRLSYNPETGVLTWLPRTPEQMRGVSGRADYWNAKFAGKQAGHFGQMGYVHICISGSSYLAHLIAWKLTYGTQPEGQIDHINGNRSDNRISNLREVTQFENQKNRKFSSNNTSGFIGVKKSGNRWAAQITVDGECFHLGCFASKEEAVSARKQAEIKFGFHPNHGRKSAA